MTTKKGKKYKTTGSLHLRSGKGKKYKSILVMPKGSTVTIVVADSSWSKVKYKTKTGYCSNNYLKLVEDKKSTSKSNKNNTKKSTSNNKFDPIDTVKDLYVNTQGSLQSRLQSNNMNGIYGSPYQFMDCVDPRISKTDFGFIYAEDIVADMPLLMVTPGNPNFLSGFSKNQRSNIVSVLASAVPGGLTKNAKNALNDLLDDKDSPRRYYTFKFDYTSYYNYVNPMLWNCATYLGIQNYKVSIGDQKNKALKNFDWKQAYNKFKKYTSTSQYVSFYLESENSIQESFSNSTTTSQLVDTINGYSDAAKELQFLQSELFGKTFTPADKASYDKTLNEFKSMSKKWLKNNSLIEKLGKGALTIASGGKLLFPEIWNDSNYSKSYDISIKLRTPDCDKLSWYLNICVPLMHLIALAAPRQLDANGYTSPFLIRAWYKGLFNVDMGMIDSLTITKGRESAWTADGLPTEIDISISIKDLYQAMFISGFSTGNNSFAGIIGGKDAKYILKNTAMMDYLASTCGIDVNKAEIKRTIEMFLILYKNNITMRPSMWGSTIQQDILTIMNSAYRSLYGLK